jgi:uncharacterized protein DUF1572
MSDQRYETDSAGGVATSSRVVFTRQKAFAEHAFNQLDDSGFFAVTAPGLNSVAVIARHLGSNMLSRWTDFLTTDGEKPTRDRDAELEPFRPDMTPAEHAAARAEVMDTWARGWRVLLETLERLTDDDLARTVTIRAVEHTVALALLRQLDHYAFHVGQVNAIARTIVGTEKWQWFTLAPGETKVFNEKLRSRPQRNQP